MATRQLTQAAQAAKMIKAEIKAAFPELQFSVRSENYSGGNSVRVMMTDQKPSVEKKIEELTNKYQYGHFDGMTDMYHYSNSRDDIPQTKYLFVENNISAELREKLKAFAIKRYGEKSEYCKSYELDTTAYRLFKGTYTGFWE